MNFQSVAFLLFLTVFLVGWRRLSTARLRRLWLLTACLGFYASNSLAACALLLGEGVFTWLIARGIKRYPARRKLLFSLGAVTLTAVLARFKYADFFLTNVNRLLGTDWSAAALVLPLGLSFMTFQQIFYLYDCCKGVQEPLSPIEFSIWLTFFPTVSSGPITRAEELAEQLRDEERLRFEWDNLAAGLYAFSLGLFKKVVLAQTLSGGVANGYARVNQLNTADAIMTILAYAFQLYFDFSGYCDMAWGIAKMLGITLPRNFDSPYRAVSVRDFWSRWHITLSRFFRTCIYIPLGGSRRGMLRTCVNLMVIFLLSGLWHGAGWGFLIWGALHGAAMVLERILQGRVRLPRWLGWLLTFAFVNVAWVYFRAPTVESANTLLGAVLRMDLQPPTQEFCTSFLLPEVSSLLLDLGTRFPLLLQVLLPAVPIFLLSVSLALCLLVRNPIRQAEQMNRNRGTALLCALALVWSVVSFSSVTPFLYVNF